MIFGLNVPEKYQSPAALVDSMSLSSPLEELVLRLFKSDPKKRPRAFELSSSEFLATNAPILDEEESAIGGSLMVLSQSLPRRSRHDSMNHSAPVMSRYVQDYVEEARLGKGGFGEVVRARKMIDGHLYAIKKITQRSKETLSEILKEVRLLSQMNHPAVVRYYNTWVETVHDFADETSEEESAIDDSEDSDSGDINIEFGDSKSRGLDFMSSSGHPMFEFDDDSGPENEGHGADDGDSDSESDDGSTSVGANTNTDPAAGPVRRRRRGSNARHFRTVMYISMEYCEKRVSLPLSYDQVGIDVNQGRHCAT
jgi:translation initiation factor 2-alpha kinase 4